MTAFTSWPDRPAQFAALDQPLDLLVIGGGIVGAGVAWEAALRGLRVAVLEKHDFASGTSSKSSKLLHGGLRYLENFEFHLVFESLAQRNHLFEDAPHVAKKLNFLFPVFKGGKDKGWVLGAGLFIYDMLAALSRPKERLWHEKLSPKRVAGVEPHIRQKGLDSAYRYTDGLTDDSRLVIETLKSAVGAGAIALNHVAVERFLKNAQGQIEGVQARDMLDGQPLDIRASVVFNATGPWADALRYMDDPTSRPRLRPTKGVHLITQAFVTDHAVVLRTNWPGEASPRVMFVVPWHGRTLIGTTDTDHHGRPDDFSYLDKDVEASSEEVAYLLEAVNNSFDVGLTPKDVISAFAGWRPLIAPPEKGVSESAISREHEVFSSASGLITIAGGKLTAYRSMARESVQAVITALSAASRTPARLAPSQIERAMLSGSEMGGQSPEAYASEQVRLAPGLSADMVRTLATRHGSHFPVLRALLENEPELGVAPGAADPGAPIFYLVEATYAVRHEAAVTLADFLARRTRLYLLAQDQGLGVAEAFARVMATDLQRMNHWSDLARDQWVTRELASYRAEVARGRATRHDNASEREAG
jgi:glycerol-3-phosphate dehydrogenase